MARGAYRMYRATPSIVLTASLGLVFGVRASMSAARTSSLSGPAWTTVDVLIAVAAVISCFDRVIVTAQGITMIRVGIPRRVPVARIHQLVLTDANRSWSRLYAEATDGKRTLITMERRTAAGKRRMDELCDRAGKAFGAILAVAPTPGPDPAAPRMSANERRRCVRGGCSAYLAEVSTPECGACGGRTQRTPS